MQKLINVLAVTSFVVSAGVVGGGVYLYANKDALIEQAKERAMKQVQDMLPSLLSVPELPGEDLPLPVETPMFNPFG